MRSEKTQVLVVGGGPVGLSTALHLDRQGVSSIVLEKHPGTATHPKASYFNVRTMEILARLGVADELYASALMPAGISFFTTLTGYRLGGIGPGDFPEHLESMMRASSTPGCVSSQVILEALLARHVDAAPNTEVRFGHEKTAIAQDASRVRAVVRDRATGEDYAIEADYAVICEGVHSATREQYGRQLLGPPAFGHVMNIYLKADLESLVEQKDQALYWIATPKAPGVFLALGGERRRFCFNTPWYPEKGERAEDYDEDRCLGLVHAALGTRSIDVKILAAGPWVLCGQVIDRYREGRVFFGGDTAHLNIPTGGFGFNTGMQETHNLAWKIAAVLSGVAPDRLLDTYHEERHAIAVFNVEKSRENATNIQRTGAVIGTGPRGNEDIDLDTERGREQRARLTEAIAEQKTHFLFLGQEIGFGYWDSPVVVPDGTPHYADLHGVADAVFTYVPNARPGARAPHVWVDDRRHGVPFRSLLELLDGSFTLLGCGEAGTAWIREAEKALLPVALERYRVGDDGDLVDLNGDFRACYGLEGGGAVLVRPDGHVAWRSAGDFASHRGPRIAGALDLALARKAAN